MARATERRVDGGLRLGQDLRSLADGLDHPEAICWSPREGVLYAGGEAGQLCWQPNRILRLSLSGELEVMVNDWSGIHLFTPTNIAFAGEVLDVLAIACLGGWSIRALDPGVRGAPLPSPIPRRS